MGQTNKPFMLSLLAASSHVALISALAVHRMDAEWARRDAEALAAPTGEGRSDAINARPGEIVTMTPVGADPVVTRAH